MIFGIMIANDFFIYRYWWVIGIVLVLTLTGGGDGK